MSPWLTIQQARAAITSGNRPDVRHHHYPAGPPPHICRCPAHSRPQGVATNPEAGAPVTTPIGVGDRVFCSSIEMDSDSNEQPRRRRSPYKYRRKASWRTSVGHHMNSSNMAAVKINWENCAVLIPWKTKQKNLSFAKSISSALTVFLLVSANEQLGLLDNTIYGTAGKKRIWNRSLALEEFVVGNVSDCKSSRVAAKPMSEQVFCRYAISLSMFGC